MGETIITDYRMQITNQDIVKAIKVFNIQYIRFLYTHDFDGKIILIAKIPEKDQLLTAKSWMKLSMKKNVYINTPQVLKPYIGKRIVYYDEKIFNTHNELFRIKPIDFVFDVIMKPKNYSDLNPHFENPGILSIPKIFINNYLNRKILTSRICFDKSYRDVIKKGHLIATIIEPPEIGNVSYLLRNSSLALITDKLDNLKIMINNANKELNNFKYMSFVKEQNMIVFEEDVNAKSDHQFRIK
jgi:hypothetical protein